MQELALRLQSDWEKVSPESVEDKDPYVTKWHQALALALACTDWDNAENRLRSSMHQATLCRRPTKARVAHSI